VLREFFTMAPYTYSTSGGAVTSSRTTAYSGVTTAPRAAAYTYTGGAVKAPVAFPAGGIPSSRASACSLGVTSPMTSTHAYAVSALKAPNTIPAAGSITKAATSVASPYTRPGTTASPLASAYAYAGDRIGDSQTSSCSGAAASPIASTYVYAYAGDAMGVSGASECSGTQPALSRTSSATTLFLDEEEPVETEAKTVVKHVCPTCGLAFDSHEEAREHWLREHAPNLSPKAAAAAAAGEKAEEAEAAPDKSASPVSEKEASSPERDPDTMRAKIVEVDDQGSPVIVREEEPSARTIVTNEDGSHRAFGEAIVKSLMSKEMDKVVAWITSMTDRTLRGLVNELSERFFVLQRQLLQRREQLKEQQRTKGLAMFDLREDCTTKDLETAYRRLARSMHPDKNGGTEEAKERFQTMRARYEELKEQFEQGDLRPANQASRGEASRPESAEPERSPTARDTEHEKEDAKETPQPEQPEEDDQAHGVEEAPDTKEQNSPSSPPPSKGAPEQQKEKVFYSRSTDPSVLQDCVQQIVKKMQILHQNLDMVERSFTEA